MIVRPTTLRAANDFVKSHHRHNKPVRGCRFCISAVEGVEIVAVAIVGRPLARPLDDGATAEVLRMCAIDGAPKGVNSMLYAACWRAWREMGGRKMLTYTLQSESGSSLKGLKEQGWRRVAEADGRERGWVRSDGHRDNQPIYAEPKFRWEVAA